MAASDRAERLYPTLPGTLSLLSMSSGEEEGEEEEETEVPETGKEDAGLWGRESSRWAGQHYQEETGFHRGQSEPRMRYGSDREEESSASFGRGSGFCHSAISLGEFEERYFSERESALQKKPGAPVGHPRSVHFSQQKNGGMWRYLVGVVSGCGQSVAGAVSWRVWVVVVCFLLGVLCASWEGMKSAGNRGTNIIISVLSAYNNYKCINCFVLH